MKIKVLLMKDVANVGQVGDVVEVAGGYARNYLLPRGLATLPTPASMRAAQKERERIEKERQERIAALRKVAERLAELEITFLVAANEEGHLYGSVSARDIAGRLAELGYDIEPEQVRIEHAYRQVGEYAVPIHLGEGVDVEIRLNVVRAEEQLDQSELLEEAPDEQQPTESQ